jgi:hypothetical protein
MEYDLSLKHFFVNDDRLHKIEMKFALEYLKCKVEKCYTPPLSNDIERVTHEEFEFCLEKCMEKSNQFNLMKMILYEDFTKFYYNKFISCANENVEEGSYYKCIEDSKLLMKKNVEDIKKIILNYQF